MVKFSMKREQIEENPVIRTSEENWVDRAMKAYTKKVAFDLVDDAKIGLTEKDVKSAINLLAFMKKGRMLKVKEISSILVGIGHYRQWGLDCTGRHCGS